jgi:dTDP-glucose 4,6-dehydratase
MVAEVFPSLPEVWIAQEPTYGKPVERYVPSTQRAREELGLEQRIDLIDAIKRTVSWYKNQDT